MSGQEDIKARKRILESDVLGRWFSRVEEWSVACRVEWNDEGDVHSVLEGAIVHEDKLAAVDCEKETKVGDWMVLRWCIGGENLGKEGAHKVTGLGGEVRSTRELVSELSLQYDVNRDRPPLSNEDSEVEVINYMGNRRKVRQITNVIDSFFFTRGENLSI
ncbi:hypothetical protein V6N11_008395 [Hibiscus sabdariffa]|uniref:Uncharacterized protein n=1 Tax=Hibiscus sabdariffa TaxID=183260 RepID=A0ABR2P8Q1_9ROSI